MGVHYGNRPTGNDRMVPKLLNHYYGSDAAAAYSLRNLDYLKRNDPVVRVRRASDNAEKDFTALQINNNELKDFVGGENWIRWSEELSNWRNEYIRDFVQSNTAQSPNGEQTADFVRQSNRDERQRISGQSFGSPWPNSGVYSFYYKYVNHRYLRFDAANNWSSIYRISVTIDTLNDTIISETGRISDIRITPLFDGWRRIEIFTGPANVNFGYARSIKLDLLNDSFEFTYQGDGSSGIYIWGVQFVSTGRTSNAQLSDSKPYTKTEAIFNRANGYVTTWYDQSGNDNHATQTTATEQPKIVDAGTLVTENGKAAVDFDGTIGQFLNTPVKLGLGETTISVVVSLTGSQNESIAGVLAMPRGNGIFFGNRDPASGTYVMDGGGAGSGNSSNTNAGIDYSFIKLITGIYTTDRTSNSFIFRNGFLDENYTNTNSDEERDDIGTLNIGFRGGFGRFLTGRISEGIIYLSNQSNNRTAIESNINSYYNIY